MEATYGSEIRTRRRASHQRKPLADLTNTNTPSAASAAASSLLKPNPSDPKPSRSSTRCASGIGSNDRENPGDQGILASTPKAKEVSANPDGDSITHDKAEDSTVYTRRSTAGRKGKGKAVAVTVSSCPPIGRLRSIGGKLNEENVKVNLPATFSVPCQKIKKRPRYTMPKELQKPVLPQDFVEKQRSYFAEIDAFELPEEVVSESELE